MATVQTYRVVRGELKVGHSIRKAGDFVPEADSWESLEAHIRVGTIEIAYVDTKVLNAFKKKVIIADAKKVVSEAIEDKKISRRRIIRKRVEVNAGIAAEGHELPEQAV